MWNMQIIYVVLFACSCFAHLNAFTFDKGTEFLTTRTQNAGKRFVLPVNFPYFGELMTDDVYVLDDGILSFNEKEDAFTSEPFPTNRADSPIIAPYFTDIDLEQDPNGNVFYKEMEEADRLLMEEVVATGFDETDFSALDMNPISWGLIATYENVARSNGPGTVSFQVAIATTNATSYAVFEYGDLQWSNANPDGTQGNNDAAVGFDAGEDAHDPNVVLGVRYFNVPNSAYPEIILINTKTNNFRGECGQLIFRIDQEAIQQPCAVQECTSGVNVCNNGERQCSPAGSVCVCDEGFKGQFCDESVDDCVEANCNFGKCIDGENTFTCECLPGYTGEACDESLDDCLEANCNYGNCIDGEGSFSCECLPGFTGEACDVSLDNCVGANCNYGRCVDGEETFTCECLPGFTGDSCDMNIDECETADCGDGTCIDQINGFVCCCEDSNVNQYCAGSSESSSSSEESSESGSKEAKGKTPKKSKKEKRFQAGKRRSLG